MRSLSILFIFFLSMSNLNAQTESLEKNKIIQCLNHPKFLSWFNICRNQKDTIYIYNNISQFDKSIVLKTSCNKILALKNSSIEINVDKYRPNCESQIVLYKFEKKQKKYLLFFKKTKYVLSFLNVCSNAHMVIKLNRRNKVVEYSTRVF